MLARRRRQSASRALCHLLLLLWLGSSQAADRTLQGTQANGGSSSGSNGDASGGSSSSSRGSSASPSPACTPSLLSIAREQPDLRTLVAVQHLSSVNFFTPFGKSSKRTFTLLAPTDDAFAAAFNNTTPEQRSALRSGFAALLLYHQVLTWGYSAEALAAQYSSQSALGASVNKQLPLDFDKEGDQIYVTGMAPDNYGVVLREYESCGAYMLVIDTLLQPVTRVSQLPLLLTEQPINDSSWQRIEAIIEEGPDASHATPGEEDMVDAAAIPAGPGAEAEAAAGEDGSSGGAGSAGGGASSGGSNGGSGSARPAKKPVNMSDLPPAPPGAPVNCTSLVASGKLITANGTLAASGCELESATVVSSGTTQTAVSDGRPGATSKNSSSGGSSSAQSMPASSAAPAGAAGGAHGSQQVLAAGVAAALAWLLLAG